MGMKKRAIVAAIGAAATLGAGAAVAQEAGSMVVGGGWLGFFPQDSSKPLTMTSPRQAEIPGSGSGVSNAHTLGLSFAYYFDKNWAVEAVVGVPPKFKLDGEGTLSGVGRLGEARQYSPTLLARYTFLDNSYKLRPFVSLGGTYVWYDSVKLTSGLQNWINAATTLPAGSTYTTAKLDSKFAPVINAGAAYSIDRHWSVSWSLSYVKLKTTAKLSTKLAANGQQVATSEARLTLDPIVSYLALNYRF